MTTLASRPSRRCRAAAAGRSTSVDEIARNESLRARRYPISRWYLRPLAGRLAHALAPTRVRPVHLTACGLLAGTAAAAILYARPGLAPISGVLILAWWFFDRTDGQLARLQGTVSAWGAWFDANADELVDVTIHVAMASAAVASATAASAPASGQTASPVAWGLLVAFLLGKYLFMHGLWTEEQTADGSGTRAATCGRSGRIGWLRALYHLPGNADVRVHLLAAALLTGWLTAELAVVAVYYNVRWMARYVLVARREGGPL